MQIDAGFSMPQRQYTIFMIGAGGIVEAAHLPAYRKAGWQVGGIYDPETSRAQLLAATFSIPVVFETLTALVAAADTGTVFDVAVPATALAGVLRQLPDGATVMMQKPMGTTIAEAQKIRDLCREKKLLAAVNFQMKFIPSIIAARNLIASGAIGTLHDMELRMNIYHPWHLWKFLYGIPRMEMLYHSIHYMDMLKSFFGLPEKVYARTWKHPLMQELASTRSVVLLDYGDLVKAHINTNHGHDFGLKHQESFVKFEGTKGAIKATIGLNIDYPNGVPDTFEYVIREEEKLPEWESVSFRTQWFPDAFIASMAALLCYAEGTSGELMDHFENAYQTMAIVEAAYQSSEVGGTAVVYQ